MFARTAPHLPAALMLVGLVLAPSFLAAHLTPEQVHAEANRIHDEAMDRTTATFKLAELPEIVGKHGEAALLRSATDPRAFDCFRLQGQLLFQSGQYEEAQGYLERAAAVALANRDIASAVGAFVEAGHAAAARGLEADARWLAQTAQRLSQHPALTRAERSSLQGLVEFRTVEVR